MKRDLLADHDGVLSDLDGVLYLGPEPITAAVDTFAEVLRREVRYAFVTNNAGRGAETVAEHLRSLGVTAHSNQVVTSAQAGAAMLAERLPAGSPVLVVGSQSLHDEARARGLRPAAMAEVLQNPSASGVLQGFEVDLPWSRLNEATRCVHAGATWVATNTDSTRPTHEGVMPGTGMMVHAVAVATGQTPLVAGKPHRPLFDAARERTGARHPIVLGDRLDTDIAGARAAGLTSLLVLTGAHGKQELATMPIEHLPDHIGWDATALVTEAAVPVLADAPGGSHGRAVTAERGAVSVDAADGRLQVTGPSDSDSQLDALRCAVALRRAGVDADFVELCDRLDALP